MWMTVVEAVIRWAVPFVLGGAVTLAVSATKKAKRREEEIKNKYSALENGIQCLLRAEIIRNHDKYTAKGFCPIYAREALTRAYSAYHALGGNDVATELFRDTLKLPTEAATK